MSSVPAGAVFSGTCGGRSSRSCCLPFLHEKEAAAFQKVPGSSHFPRKRKEELLRCVWLRLGEPDCQSPTGEMLACKIAFKQSRWDQCFGLFSVFSAFQKCRFARASDVSAVGLSSTRCNTVTCAVPH